MAAKEKNTNGTANLGFEQKLWLTADTLIRPLNALSGMLRG